jgi:hypothetical protein
LGHRKYIIHGGYAAGTYSITAKATDDRGNTSCSEEQTVTVGSYGRIVVAADHFDHADFTISSAAHPDPDVFVDTVLENYSIARRGFEVISAVASPDNNDGSAKPGKSIRLYRPYDPLERTASMCRSLVSSPGVGSYGGRIARSKE